MKYIIRRKELPKFFTREEKDDGIISAESGDKVITCSGEVEFRRKFKSYKMFTKADRSSFRYWFAHWCSYQVVALNNGIWRPKYLLHDIEKPWLKLWYRGDYKKVQSFHRLHNCHHLEYGLTRGWDKMDWQALVIDWECCAYSKLESQLDARETLEYEVARDKWKAYEEIIRRGVEPILNKLGL